MKHSFQLKVVKVTAIDSICAISVTLLGDYLKKWKKKIFLFLFSKTDLQVLTFT